MVFLGTIPWCSGRSVVHARVPWFETFNGEQFGFRFHVHPNWMFIHPGWWFGTFFIFHILGIRSPTDVHIFQRSWNHQPVMFIHVFVQFIPRYLLQKDGSIPPDRCRSTEALYFLGADEPHVPRRQRERERERWQKVRWGATRLAKKIR